MRPPSLTRWILVLALGVSAGAAYFPLRAHLLPEGVLPGLTVDGVVPPSSDAAEVRAFVAARADALRGRRVELTLGKEGRSLGVLTLGELGVSVDEARITELVMTLGHDDNLANRIDLARRSARGELDIPLSPRVDAAQAMAMLERIKEAEDKSPVSARLDLEHHTVTTEKEGLYVDADATIALVSRAARDAHGARAADAETMRIELPFASFPARMNRAYVSSLDIHTTLAEYETYFSRSGDQSRRGENIDVAAQKLDGLVLSPGELVSFNQIVGERSEENGFKKSWEIFKGEMTEGVGGGTCQVASTLHAVAFFGGLEILERLPHSRPSAYIPMGLDATVVYPVVDMKLKNPHPFPVVLHTKVEGNKLRIELLGASKPARVSFERELIKTVPYTRKIEEKTGLTARRVRVKQHGIRGFRIERKRIFVYKDGRRREEKTKDFYPPTTEIYEVAPGFDVSLLPPLPTEDGDTGEGSDTSAATAQAAPVVVPPLPAPEGSPANLLVEDAPGAHAPTTTQANPAKTMTIRR
ncbi:MAG: Vancomycin B-type resistance protein VanW [Myxococcaceae bacterium]|nr:Vancomycin B-type resistance protein VanW [Myxococcaceae bacterium]